MAQWIIDDGPLGLLVECLGEQGFQHTRDLTLFIAEQTSRDAQHRRPQTFINDCSILHTFQILLGSQTSEILYRHLGHTSSSETKNLAERQSIAWALAENTQAIFVSLDKRACVEALAELGRGRVAHAYDLWFELYAQEHITIQQFQSLCEKTRKNQNLKNIPLRCSNIITNS